MKLPRWAAAAVCLSALGSTMAACGGGGDPQQPPPPASAQVQENDAPATPERFRTNERGHVPSEIGEEVVYFEDMSGDRASFTIDSVELDPACYDSYGTPPGPGEHNLLLNITVKTGSDQQIANDLGTLLTFANWNEIGGDGVTRNTPASTCSVGDPEETLTIQTPFGPNQTYQGTVSMAVSQPHGTLALVDVNNIPMGWEFQY